MSSSPCRLYQLHQKRLVRKFVSGENWLGFSTVTENRVDIIAMVTEGGMREGCITRIHSATKSREMVLAIRRVITTRRRLETHRQTEEGGDGVEEIKSLTFSIFHKQRRRGREAPNRTGIATSTVWMKEPATVSKQDSI